MFLEDHAALILGLLELYQTDFNNRWFVEAFELAGEMLALFSDPAGGFFDTAADAETLLTRPKDLQDNATPSGNALAVEALLKLAAFTGKTEWEETALKALSLASDLSSRYPTAFSRWLSAADFALGQKQQVAIIGDPSDEDTKALIREVHKAFRPNQVIAASSYPPPAGAPALLADRPMLDGKPTTYVCEGFVCKRPVTRAEELSELLS